MDALIDWLFKNPTFPVVLISAVIAFLAFRTTRHLSRSKHAIDFETDYHHSSKLSGALAKLVEWSKKSTPEETAALAQAGDHEMVPHIRELLNTWERAAIAIRQNVYDERLLYNAYGSSVIWIWKQTVPYIRQRQRANPRLYINFDWLVITWLIRRDSREDAANLAKLKAAHKLLSSIR